MKKNPLLLSYLVIYLALLSAVTYTDLNIQDCQWRKINLYGKVQVVESFPDIKVQVVTSFPELKVQRVDAFPNSCGKWQFVDSFPDFKIQFVDAFPDLKIQYVDSLPRNSLSLYY